MDASCSTLCARASVKGQVVLSPWSCNPEPLGQGFYPRPHPGKWSAAWGVKHRDVTSASSTNTKKLNGLQLWYPLLAVFEMKWELCCHSCSLVGESLVESRSCPIMIPLLVVQNKNSERRVLWSATCIIIRQLLLCRKISKIYSVMTHCPSSRTFLWAFCQQEQYCPEASVSTQQETASL